MGAFTRLLTLPVAGPLNGSLWLARKIHDAAQDEFHNPNAIRAELARLEAELIAGRLTEDAYDAAELVLLQRLRDASG